MEDPYATPKYEIVLTEDLNYTCVVFGWPLPNDNKLYKKFCRSLRNITISNLLAYIQSMKLCTCVNGDFSVESHPELISHTISCKIDIHNITDGLPFMGTRLSDSAHV